MDEIKVSVVKFPDRKNLMLKYIDPITGKQRYKSACTNLKRDAEKSAGKWEAELREGRYAAPCRIAWPDFRRRYEDEALPKLADRTAEPRMAVMNHIERILSPRRVADLTAERLSYFESKLREIGLKDSTIAGQLAHLKSILSWAVTVGMLRAVPKIKMPTRNLGGKLMRGRPVTAEEFDRMLAKVATVRPKDAARWERYLLGLWLAGLRLEESLALTWDADGAFTVDLSGKYPRFRIYAEAEKGHQDRLLPMTPDFAQWLLATPQIERSGFVFHLGDNRQFQRSLKRVSRVVSEIGQRAGVVVNKEQGKFASCHDLRRSFGTRWSSKVKPATLQVLMRHASIETTLRYYVAQDADDVARELWAGTGYTSGYSQPILTDSSHNANATTSSAINS